MDRARTARAGFTLIELLAVIAILGLLMTLAVPLVSKARATANLRACQSNLRQIAGSLKLWADNRNKNRWPQERGIKFLLVLVRDGELSDKEVEKVFVCPQTDDSTSLPGDTKPASGLKDWESIDKTCISYAGRDAKTFPVNKNKESDEAIASDDNDGRANHSHLTNVVYADSRIDTIDVKDFKADLAEDAEWVTVGPDSPSPDLKKLLNE